MGNQPARFANQTYGRHANSMKYSALDPYSRNTDGSVKYGQTEII